MRDPRRNYGPQKQKPRDAIAAGPLERISRLPLLRGLLCSLLCGLLRDLVRRCLGLRRLGLRRPRLRTGPSPAPRLLLRRRADGSLRRRKPCQRHAERRAAHVAHPRLEAELHAVRVTAVLPADPDLEPRLHGAALVDAHLDELTNAVLVDGLERVSRQDLLVQVVGEEAADVVPG